MWLALVAVFLLLLGTPAAKAQNTVVSSCTATGKNYSLGLVLPGTMDVTGILCTNATGGGGGGGGTVTQGPAGPAWNIQGAVNQGSAGPAWNVQGTVFSKLQDALGNNITSTSNALNTYITGSGVTLSVQGSGTFTTSDTTHFPATQALSDALSNPTVSGIGSYLLLWDATNTVWRRGQAAAGTGQLQVNFSGPSFGAAFPATGTAVGFKNGSGNMDFAKVDANNNLNIDCGGNPCNATDNGAYSNGVTGYSNIGCFWQTTYTTGPLTTGEAGVAQCGSKYRSLSGTLYDSLGTELDNTTAHAVNVALLDSGGTSMSDANNHAVIAEVYTSGAAITSAFQPLVCNKTAKVHVTSGTDTQIVAASGSQTIYVCDYRFSTSAALNFYLEKATSGTCATLTQIDILWTLVANQAKTDAKAIYSGLNTGASAQLCVNTTAGNLDLAVNYAQF